MTPARSKKGTNFSPNADAGVNTPPPLLPAPIDNRQQPSAPITLTNTTLRTIQEKQRRLGQHSAGATVALPACTVNVVGTTTDGQAKKNSHRIALANNQRFQTALRLALARFGETNHSDVEETCTNTMEHGWTRSENNAVFYRSQWSRAKGHHQAKAKQISCGKKTVYRACLGCFFFFLLPKAIASVGKATAKCRRCKAPKRHTRQWQRAFPLFPCS